MSGLNSVVFDTWDTVDDVDCCGRVIQCAEHNVNAVVSLLGYFKGDDTTSPQFGGAQIAYSPDDYVDGMFDQVSFAHHLEENDPDAVRFLLNLFNSGDLIECVEQWVHCYVGTSSDDECVLVVSNIRIE